MNKLGGLLITGIVGIGLVSSSYTGQEKLDATEQMAVAYSNKATEVAQIAKSLQSENEALRKEVSDLKAELDRNWNTVEEVNALIEETKVLRHVISTLEEQIAQLESGQAVVELEKANQEIEKANQSAQTHYDEMTTILDETVLDEVLNK